MTRLRKPNGTWRGDNASAHAPVALPPLRYCRARGGCRACRRCSAALHVRATRPWPAVEVTRRHDSATAPTGGAADLLLRRCARGCAATAGALMQSATLPLVSCWEEPVHQALSAQSCLRGRPISWPWRCATLVSQIADNTPELAMNRRLCPRAEPPCRSSCYKPRYEKVPQLMVTQRRAVSSVRRQNAVGAVDYSTGPSA